MSVLSQQPATAPVGPGLPCSVVVALDRLDAESRADLKAWLRGERPELGHDGDMWARLQGLGLRVGRQTIGRHRRYVLGVGADKCRCAS